jgi:hypothetical protein
MLSIGLLNFVCRSYKQKRQEDNEQQSPIILPDKIIETNNFDGNEYSFNEQ